ncbi:MAG: cardiolipin synthase [Acutalibacteraceae bacterium]|nr:cardiolipin synthase [Acutalibacteraceae bacterium]
MKEKKRGIRIKTRVILTALVLIVALGSILIGVVQLQHNFLPIYSVLELIGIIAVIYIVNRRDNPSYKIAWIVFILVLPVFGLIVYTMWGGQRTFPHLKKRMKIISQKYEGYLEQDPAIIRLLNYEDTPRTRQATYLSNESGFPIYQDSKVTYLSPGDKFLTTLIDELSKAEKYIYLEYFILANGKMWDAIYDVLRKKSSDGVEIKVMFDDFGSIKRQYRNFVSRLKQDGIEVSIFCPIKPSLNIVMNNRNHRKIIIIDGNVAFTGGINIADEYINEIERFGYWMDCAVMVKGKAVDSFVAMFCTMWEYTTGKNIPITDKLTSVPQKSESYVIPYCDGPMDSKSAAEGIYLQILNTAHKYVDIASPYLILDDNMKNAIILAAKSGVRIRIITPFIPDKKYVHPVTQYYYSELLEAGVQIFEYTPGFIHSKLFISDDSYATAGTVNMDYRSFFFHFECGVWFTSEDTIKEMKAHFEQLVSDSTEITAQLWKKRSISQKFKQWLLHIFSPLM